MLSGMVTMDRGWHLDKKVPLGIIGTLLLQTILFTWAASGVYHQIGVHDVSIAELRGSNKAQDDRFNVFLADRSVNLQRLSKVEQSMDDIKTTLGRIDNKLDVLRNRINP